MLVMASSGPGRPPPRPPPRRERGRCRAGLGQMCRTVACASFFG